MCNKAYIIGGNFWTYILIDCIQAAVLLVMLLLVCMKIFSLIYLFELLKLTLLTLVGLKHLWA
jgi:hypothetical protein